MIPVYILCLSVSLFSCQVLPINFTTTYFWSVVQRYKRCLTSFFVVVDDSSTRRPMQLSYNKYPKVWNIVLLLTVKKKIKGSVFTYWSIYITDSHWFCKKERWYITIVELCYYSSSYGYQIILHFMIYIQ